ncbi:metabotropic glutamate receptor 3-like isoform X2 [Gordionus sp. m RMFG-2023]|uniref:metabotropic glutamate receptor 3-like isoform X2 n=1 Tax=Gordionus sp. m RMFG-2023 TaxID=3053472 RepID=UPI0031FC5E99
MLIMTIMIFFAILPGPMSNSMSTVYQYLDRFISLLRDINEKMLYFNIFMAEAVALKYPGDIILGGLFPIHLKGNDEAPCGNINVERGIQRFMAMLYAVELINNDTNLLPGIKLGVNILDTCARENYALNQSLEFVRVKMSLLETQAAEVGRQHLDKSKNVSSTNTSNIQIDKQSLHNLPGSGKDIISSKIIISNMSERHNDSRFTSEDEFGEEGDEANSLVGGNLICTDGSAPRYKKLPTPVLGVIGGSYSGVSIQVANLLRLFKIPQISYASTSSVLSDKSRYDYFARTVPPDQYQARAMVDISVMLGWTYVSTVASQGDYGESGIDSFNAEAKKKNICVAVPVKIPMNAKPIDFDIILKSLNEKPNAKVIILFLKIEDAADFLKAMKRSQLKNDFVLISGDGWGREELVVRGREEVAHGAITIELQSNRIPGFDTYFKRLHPSNFKAVDKIWRSGAPWLIEFWEQQFNCDLDLKNSYYSINQTKIKREILYNDKLNVKHSFALLSRYNFLNKTSNKSNFESKPIQNSLLSFYKSQLYLLNIKDLKKEGSNMRQSYISGNIDSSKMHLPLINILSECHKFPKRFLCIQKFKGVLQKIKRALTNIPSVGLFQNTESTVKNIRMRKICDWNQVIDDSNYMQEGKTQFIIDAVYAMAHALHKFQQDRCRRKRGACKELKKMDGAELFKGYILNMSFINPFGQTIRLDNHGDGIPKYNILNYRFNPVTKLYEYKLVGIWDEGLNLNVSEIKWKNSLISDGAGKDYSDKKIINRHAMLTSFYLNVSSPTHTPILQDVFDIKRKIKLNKTSYVKKDDLTLSVTFIDKIRVDPIYSEDIVIDASYSDESIAKKTKDIKMVDSKNMSKALKIKQSQKTDHKNLCKNINKDVHDDICNKHASKLNQKLKSTDLKKVDYEIIKIKIPISRCSEPCQRGEIKNMQKGEVCCWICTKCQPWEYVVNETTCWDCGIGWWPRSPKLDSCYQLPLRYIIWSSIYAIIPICISLIGVLLTTYVGLIFLINIDTPLVKASGRELSFMLLGGITICYLCTFPLLAKPTLLVCGLQRFMIGFGFAVMYSSLLTKTNRISRIFNSASRSAKRPTFISPTSQMVIALILITVQIVMNAIWFLLEVPGTRNFSPENKRDIVILKCRIKDTSFLFSLAYNIILIIICTVYAVKTRKIPENFNESKFIGFSMYTTCIIWLAFIPIYFSTLNEFQIQTTTLCITISLSASVTLFCLFGPKIYIIVFHPEKNVRKLTMGSAGYAKTATNSSSTYNQGKNSLTNHNIPLRIGFNNNHDELKSQKSSLNSEEEILLDKKKDLIFKNTIPIMKNDPSTSPIKLKVNHVLNNAENKSKTTNVKRARIIEESLTSF